jgi:hypothetical protein
MPSGSGWPPVAGSVRPDGAADVMPGGDPLSWESPLPEEDEPDDDEDDEEPEEEDDPDEPEPDPDPEPCDPDPDWPESWPLNGSWYWLSPAPWARAVAGRARTSATMRTAQRDIGPTL